MSAVIHEKTVAEAEAELIESLTGLSCLAVGLSKFVNTHTLATKIKSAEDILASCTFSNQREALLQFIEIAKKTVLAEAKKEQTKA